MIKVELELPYQLAPDKTTLKLQGMPTKTTRPTGTLPTGYDTGILIKVPDEQHVLHVGRWEPEGYAEQLFPRQHPRVEAVRNPVSVQKN